MQIGVDGWLRMVSLLVAYLYFIGILAAYGQLTKSLEAAYWQLTGSSMLYSLLEDNWQLTGIPVAAHLYMTNDDVGASGGFRLLAAPVIRAIKAKKRRLHEENPK